MLQAYQKIINSVCFWRWWHVSEVTPCKKMTRDPVGQDRKIQEFRVTSCAAKSSSARRYFLKWLGCRALQSALHALTARKWSNWWHSLLYPKSQGICSSTPKQVYLHNSKWRAMLKISCYFVRDLKWCFPQAHWIKKLLYIPFLCVTNICVIPVAGKWTQLPLWLPPLFPLKIMPLIDNHDTLRTSRANDIIVCNHIVSASIPPDTKSEFLSNSYFLSNYTHAH